jgi:hypothetical protein
MVKLDKMQEQEKWLKCPDCEGKKTSCFFKLKVEASEWETGIGSSPSPLRSICFISVVSCIMMMGRTIPSFRIAAEMERGKWRDFRSLLNRKDRKSFDQMFSYVRYYNSNCMMQANPVLFYSVMMSILFHLYKQLMNLKGMKNILLPLNRPEPSANYLSGTLDRYCNRGE